MTSFVDVPRLGATQSLPEFLDTTGHLTADDMSVIVSQALILIDDLYVHLPLKKAMHAIDPVQRLKLLKRRLESMDELSFHREMLSIFIDMRDLHTRYMLPSPFAGKIAFLPFLLEEYYEDGARRYMVSHILAGLDSDTFKRGCEITHWNGVPIDRAVEVNADREAGSNVFARHVRGLETMTVRPMRTSLPPDAEWVHIRYIRGDETLEIRLPWRVGSSHDLTAPVTEASTDTIVALEAMYGIDEQTELINRARKLLFAPRAMEIEEQTNKLLSGDSSAAESADANLEFVSTMPKVFKFQTVDTPSGQFGYLRIWTFNTDPALFIEEVQRILGLLPQEGLIIDVRGNGGGTIPCGERMLQLFTDKPITPERFQFINTERTLQLSQAGSFQGHFNPWIRSIELSLQTGAVYSQAFPITDDGQANAIGRIYRGKVVVVTDARCYSTTDIFAAGFQDHEIGIVLGVDGNTGAGGANVLSHKTLRTVFAGTSAPLDSLPNGASFNVALRQSVRVGANSGLPLEDIGVVPDHLHPTTRNDLLNDNVDLINAAAEFLAP